MTNMTFFLAPDTLQAVQSDLTKTALDALRARADEVANDLGMKIDHYQNINVGNAFESAEANRGSTSTSSASAAGTPAAQGGRPLLAYRSMPMFCWWGNERQLKTGSPDKQVKRGSGLAFSNSPLIIPLSRTAAEGLSET
jgi:hypothetical protein